jgi:2,3-dihydroxy-p-cumate/2,3-dihydroxybenzoate 3,4-dioxygenase
MRGMDEMMRGLGRLLPTPAKLVWGPGRHTAGDNTFAYFLTPGGNNFEYTAELEKVGEDWKATRYEMSFSVTDQWGTGRMHEGLGPHRVAEPDPALWQVPPF